MCVCVCVCVCVLPPHEQDETQGQFLNGVKEWNETPVYKRGKYKVRRIGRRASCNK